MSVSWKGEWVALIVESRVDKSNKRGYSRRETHGGKRKGKKKVTETIHRRSMPGSTGIKQNAGEYTQDGI